MYEKGRKQDITGFLGRIPLLWGGNMQNTKIKAVLPTLREKKRYLAFEIISESKISDIKAVSTEMLKAIGSFLGSMQAGKAGLKLIQELWSPERQRGIIKVGHKYVEQLKAALALIKDISGQKVIVRSVGLSGTIKKAKMRYLA